MIQPGIEPRSSGSLVNTLTTIPMGCPREHNYRQILKNTKNTIKIVAAFAILNLDTYFRINYYLTKLKKFNYIQVIHYFKGQFFFYWFMDFVRFLFLLLFVYIWGFSLFLNIFGCQIEEEESNFTKILWNWIDSRVYSRQLCIHFNHWVQWMHLILIL